MTIKKLLLRISNDFDKLISALYITIDTHHTNIIIFIKGIRSGTLTIENQDLVPIVIRLKGKETKLYYEIAGDVH